MKQILLFALLIPFLAAAQAPIKIVGDTSVNHPNFKGEKNRVFGVILSNGFILTGGMDVRLIKGSLPNGDYNYIATPSNTMEAKLRASTTLKEMPIFVVRRKGNKKFGYKYIFATGIGNYNVQLEDALAAGEIELK